MSVRPYVLLSCAMSMDGYIDDTGPRRLLLSNEADLDRVDEVRAGCDAILIGANTIRRDDPRLLIRSEERRRRRLARGLPEHPAKVTITSGGDLDPNAAFFTAGSSVKYLYCPPELVPQARGRFGRLARVVDLGRPPDLPAVLADLARQDVGRLLVEGGTRLHAQVLGAGLVDEIHLAVAPFLVGDPKAPRFAGEGPFPHDVAHRFRLAEVRRLDDVVLLRYLNPDTTGARSASAA